MKYEPEKFTQNQYKENSEKTSGDFSYDVDVNEFITDLAPFFDLLAKFDYQDKQKEKLALNPDLLASAPRGSELDSNSKN